MPILRIEADRCGDGPLALRALPWCLAGEAVSDGLDIGALIAIGRARASGGRGMSGPIHLCSVCGDFHDQPPAEIVVGYHVEEGVSLFNHHIMACVEHTPADRLQLENVVTLAEAQRYEDEGFPYFCDTCEEPLLPAGVKGPTNGGTEC